MKGDFTRWTYRPSKGYSAVLLQQGRVLMDADWNEQREIDLGSRRVLASDLIGRAGGPAGALGFAVDAVDLDGDGLRELVLRAGRYYVDGILCELHEDTPVAAQPALGGADPTVTGDPPAPLPDGRYAVYLDVFERHVTYIEDPHIKEKALGGPDHTTRKQIVAQARLLPLDDLAVDECTLLHDPDLLADHIEGAPRGRLAASVDPAPPALDPCVVPASAGYRGLENQLYRVEIHQSSADGTPTFKWSRENGSVVTAWDALLPDSGGVLRVIEVADLGPDSERSFATADTVVELLDDSHQLAPAPGLLARVEEADEASRTIVLKDPVHPDGSAAAFTDLARGSDDLRPRVRRWDGPLRAIDGTWQDLELGIRVRLEPGRSYRSGDYWLIPARTVDGTIEWGDPTDFQEPHGNRHRYTCLAIVVRGSGEWTVERACVRTFPSLVSLLRMAYAGGDGQQGVLGEELPAPLRVQVLNGAVGGGAPHEHVSVRFEIADAASDGVLTDPATSATGASLDVPIGPDGIAEVRWRLATEAAWAATPALIDQTVRATLLDECGDPTDQTLVFSAHESQAREVRYDNTVCPAMDALHASGHETDHVQRALDVLCGNPHVSYVSGDGQEAMPGDALPNRLVVRVGNGAWPMPNQDVLFTLIDLETGADASAESWAGSLTGGTAVATWPSTRARVVRVTTDARGEASVRWTLGSTPGAERPGVRAQLELHSPYDALGDGADVRFAGRWSLASGVAYEPACEHLVEAGVTTVDAALDALCLSRTLYYVAGTGQAASLGAELPVPLTVRVANEGEPIANASVRFRIEALDGGGIDEQTGGTLDTTGAADSATWGGTSGVREIRVLTDADGIAVARWTYAATAGAIPGVQATLLDDSLAATTSIIRFGAVLAGRGEDAGIHVLGTSMVDRAGVERKLWNDSTVDPFHLLDEVRVHCDRAVDHRTLRGNRTAYLKIEVPYGWPPKGKKPDSDPYFAPEGVQHTDAHVLAGELSTEGDAIVFAPSTAARRMLVSTTAGPMTHQSPYWILLPQDSPLPVRLAIYGAGEKRVRATLVVEGDFVTDRERLHVDGEALGERASTGRIDLDFPSGDGVQGGDFRTWFWLEGRIWAGLGAFENDRKIGEHDTVGTPVIIDGVRYDLGVTWYAAGRLHVGWYAFDEDRFRSQSWDGLPPQTPATWPRTREDGSPDGHTVGAVLRAGEPPSLVRVTGDGNVKLVRLEQVVRPLVLPPAADAPRGAELDGREALAWRGADGDLLALVETSGEWELTYLGGEATNGAVVRDLADAIEWLRRGERPGRPVGGRLFTIEVEDLPRSIDRVGRLLGLPPGARSGLLERVRELTRGTGGRAELESALREALRARAGKRFGSPVVLVADGTLHVIAQADSDEEPALLAFRRASDGDFETIDLGARLKGWEPAIDGRLAGDAGLDFEGETVMALAWRTKAGQVLVARKRGASSWSLEEIDAGDAKLSDEPLALAVDGLGVIHVIATTSSGEHLDWWSDHRTDWTLTAVSERVKLAHAGGPAAVTRSIDGEQLVVTSPPSGSQGGLQLASFGLPRSVGPVASDESVKPIAELVRRLTR